MEDINKFKDIIMFGEKIRVFEDGRVYLFERTIKRSDGYSQHIKGYYPKQQLTTYGYRTISIVDESHIRHRVHVHDIVAKCFCPNDYGYKEVHHIDGNKENNNYRNLMWCSRKFNVDEMVKFYGKQKKIRYCLDCGVRVSDNADYCIKCVRNHAKHKVSSSVSDSKIESILFLNKGNFTKSAKLFGITDNALRKRCIKLGLPTKSSCYK